MMKDFQATIIKNYIENCKKRDEIILTQVNKNDLQKYNTRKRIK